MNKRKKILEKVQNFPIGNTKRTKRIYRSFPGGTVVKTALPIRVCVCVCVYWGGGVGWIRPLVKELDPECHN